MKKGRGERGYDNWDDTSYDSREWVGAEARPFRDVIATIAAVIGLFILGAVMVWLG
jgi:hypothetical protein